MVTGQKWPDADQDSRAKNTQIRGMNARKRGRMAAGFDVFPEEQDLSNFGRPGRCVVGASHRSSDF